MTLLLLSKIDGVVNTILTNCTEYNIVTKTIQGVKRPCYEILKEGITYTFPADVLSLYKEVSTVR